MNRLYWFRSDDGSEGDRLVFGDRDSTATDTAQERISRELDQRTAREEALMYEEAENKPAETIEKPAPEPVTPVVPQFLKRAIILLPVLSVWRAMPYDKKHGWRKGIFPGASSQTGQLLYGQPGFV